MFKTTETLNGALAQREPITGREVWVNITFCDSLSCGWNCSKTPKLIPLITGANSRSSQPLCIELCIACSSPTECMADRGGIPVPHFAGYQTWHVDGNITGAIVRGDGPFSPTPRRIPRNSFLGQPNLPVPRRSKGSFLAIQTVS